MLRDDLLCTRITVTSRRGTKIFWNTPFLGPDFDADNQRVWTYLAHRRLETPGWSHIKRYQTTNDGRQVWLALGLFYGGRVENTRKIVVACAALEQFSWSNEGTFKFNDYATQLINHFDTLERGGQGKTDEEKVTKLRNSMSTSNGAIGTRMVLNRQGVTMSS